MQHLPFHTVQDVQTTCRQLALQAVVLVTLHACGKVDVVASH